MKILIWLYCALLSFSVLADQRQQLKLVVLAPNLVELIFSLDAGKQIIATSEHADYPQAARGIPQVGNYAAVQLEKVVALKPDLVLVWHTGTPAADVARLQQLGLKVVSFETRTLDDIALQLEQLGRLLGREQAATALATDFRQRLTQLRQQYQDATKIRVFYELWHQPLSTVSEDSWPQQHLALCGAENIFAKAGSAYPQVAMEQVLLANPQLIIQPLSENEPRQLVDWHRWPQLAAVKNNQFIQPDSDILHRATLRTLDGVANFCREIAKSRQFYAQVIANPGR